MPSPEDFSTEQLKDAIMEFLKNTKEPTVKTVRRGISVKLGMEPKALDVRKSEIKMLAFECISLVHKTDPVKKNNEENNGKNEIEEDQNEKQKENIKQDKRGKKRKRKSKKSGKNNDSFVVEEASDDEVSTIKEKDMNSDVEAYSDSEEEEKTTRKRKKGRASKRNRKPATGRLAKLRTLAKITGNTNPKLYKLWKTMSEKEQVDHLEKLFDERNIDYADLSKSALQRIKKESSLQREIAELGVSGIITSEGSRTRRTRKKVNYNLNVISKIEDLSEESGQENDMEDKAEDFYEPSGDEASDYEPSE